MPRNCTTRNRLGRLRSRQTLVCTREKHMATQSLGLIRHNLLVQFDNEKGFEFRVQCEALIRNINDGNKLADALAKRTVDGLEAAKKIALANLDNRATDAFRKTVVTAFDENIEFLKRQDNSPDAKPAARKN
jgi:hypothetical protein